jgi:hypothetical protein
VVSHHYDYHLGTMWFPKASRLVRLLITLIDPVLARFVLCPAL